MRGEKRERNFFFFFYVIDFYRSSCLSDNRVRVGQLPEHQHRGTNRWVRRPRVAKSYQCWTYQLKGIPQIAEPQKGKWELTDKRWANDCKSQCLIFTYLVCLFFFLSWNWAITEYRTDWICWTRRRSWLTLTSVEIESRTSTHCSPSKSLRIWRVWICLTMRRRTWTTTGKKCSVLYRVCDTSMGWFTFTLIRDYFNGWVEVVRDIFLMIV